MTLPPALAALWEALEDARRTTLEMAGSLTEEEFLARPPGGWSAADVLEHLLLAETGTSKVIRKVLKENAGTLPPYPADDAALAAPVPRPAAPMTQAPEIALPKGGKGKAQILDEARACREQTRVSLEMLAGVDPRSAAFPHPFFGSLDLLQWPSVIVLGHEREHHRQLRGILSALGK